MNEKKLDIHKEEKKFCRYCKDTYKNITENYDISKISKNIF